MKKRHVCLLLSLAACGCLAFGAVGCDESGGREIEQGGSPNNESSAPVYLGMSIEIPAPQRAMSSESDSAWTPNDEIYKSRSNCDIQITVHFTNPRKYDISSFTLNGKKYESEMYEQDPDRKNVVLEVAVGEFDGVAEYTIDAIKYIDEDEIEDVKIGGDRTVKLYREYVVNYHDTYEAELPTAYTILSETISFEDLSRTGYRFLGFYTDERYAQRIESVEKGSKGDLDVYAKWELVEYDIVYHLDGGVNGNNPEKYTVEDEVSLAQANKTGNIFAGWFEDEACSKPAESLENATGNREFYAKWELAEYKINYHLGGGKKGENPDVFTIEDSVVFRQAQKTGATFLGWFEDAAYTIKIDAIEKGSTGDRDVYAKWELFNYNIAYHLDGGENSENNPQSYTVDDKIEFANARKQGKIFIGWYRDKGHKDLVRTLENETGDLELYAMWTDGTEGLEFRECEGGYEVSGYHGESKDVLIPDICFCGDPVLKIGEKAFVDCAILESVIIPNGATQIGDYAFCGCSLLAKIEIPNSVTRIGNSAFRGCILLAKIVIPDGVTYIGEEIFAYCSKLKSVSLGNGITEIAERSFVSCKALTEIYFHDGLREIGKRAFYDCSALQNVKIPESVTRIGDSAFCLCSALKEILIPDSVIAIGKSAFFNCGALKNIKLSEGMTKIEERTFGLCAELSSVTIPDGVMEIGFAAFSNCSQLESVAISGGMTKIEPDAFSQCSALKEFVIPEGVSKIESDTFKNCTSLERVEVPNGVTEVAQGAFESCKELKKIELPNSVTKIGSRAFLWCKVLESVNIPEGVTEIGQEAFEHCYAIKEIVIPDSVTKIGENAFRFGESLESVTIGRGVREIRKGAFSFCGDRFTEIVYTGTRDDWNTIVLDKGWGEDSPIAKIICKGDDTEIDLSGK